MHQGRVNFAWVFKNEDIIQVVMLWLVVQVKPYLVLVAPCTPQRSSHILALECGFGRNW